MLISCTPNNNLQGRYVYDLLKLFKTNSMIKKYYQSIFLIFTAAVLLSLGSCDPAKKYEKSETEAIANYLSSNPADTFKLESDGLYYLDVLDGTGRSPVAHDTAHIVYTGKFTDGTVFDTNTGGADLVFPVGEGYLISGLDEGVTFMKEGGKATFLIPSKLAYGTQGYYTIPGYSPLVFDVQLVKVIPGPSK
jgi:FKBP-type peptidyl-prolyl cis-trans isomerase FkpA